MSTTLDERTWAAIRSGEGPPPGDLGAFPWEWVALGGVLAAVGIAIAVARKKEKAAA